VFSSAKLSRGSRKLTYSYISTPMPQLRPYLDFWPKANTSCVVVA
jgi:hypothetical protein